MTELVPKEASAENSYLSQTRSERFAIATSFFHLLVALVLVKQGTQLDYRVFLERGQDMRVDVQSHRHVAMAQELLYELRVDAHGEQVCDHSVPQIVKSHRRRLNSQARSEVSRKVVIRHLLGKNLISRILKNLDLL